MRGFMWLVAVVAFGGCGVAVEPEGAEAASAAEQASFSYFPMGFARVSAAGGVVTQFNKAGGSVVVAHSTGSYTVTFNGLGTAVVGAAIGGNVQITAEGASNVRCRSMGWNGSTNLAVSVQCNAPDGTLADSAFSVLFFRYEMPTPNAFPVNYAYTWVTASGGVSPSWDYNSSGTHNTVTKTGTGAYSVHLVNATAVNASMMVTSHGGAAGTVCAVAYWIPGWVDVDCSDRLGNPADSAFSFSYSLSGPTMEQQGAHAWFNGTLAHTSYAAALGKSWDSPASITGSRSSSLATMVVSGELGSRDATQFLRASFASKYGAPGYCKVESLTSVEGATSTATSTVRCYTATGAVVATPQFTFTHATSDTSSI